MPSPGFNRFPGTDLLSHTVARAVPSALEVLTSVFGTGTGVAPPLRAPGNSLSSVVLNVAKSNPSGQGPVLDYLEKRSSNKASRLDD